MSANLYVDREQWVWWIGSIYPEWRKIPPGHFDHSCGMVFRDKGYLGEDGTASMPGLNFYPLAKPWLNLGLADHQAYKYVPNERTHFAK